MAETTLQNSLGAARVRLSFNPGELTDVDTIKRGAAELINLCEGFKDMDPRLASLAQTAFEEGAMWAVKAATAKAPDAEPSKPGPGDDNQLGEGEPTDRSKI